MVHLRKHYGTRFNTYKNATRFCGSPFNLLELPHDTYTIIHAQSLQYVSYCIIMYKYVQMYILNHNICIHVRHDQVYFHFQ